MTESWHWPEHIAAQLVGMSEEKAGARLIMTAAPELWQTILVGHQIVTENRGAIMQCERQLETAREPVSCTILIRKAASE